MAQPAFLVSGFLDEINATTRRHIVPEMADGVFRNDPLLAMLRANNLEKFPGGMQIQHNFLYSAMGGGSYAPGDSFPVTRSQIQTGGSWQPKHYYVPVTEFLEVVNVYNKGPEAVFRIIDVDMQAAALTMSARLSIDLYQGGQSARIQKLNGMAEILNDGTNNSFDGASYAAYGTVTRSSVGSALTSPLTSPTANVAGPITYKLLEETYNSICIGPEYPDVIITTNLGMSYVKQKFQPQWRTETQDARLGFNSLVFNQAKIFQSQYCPGTVAPESSTLLGWTTVAAGETMFFLNSKTFRFWVSDDPLFGFGFTGFKVAQDNTVVAGQYLFAGNVTNPSPRYSRHLYAITG